VERFELKPWTDQGSMSLNIAWPVFAGLGFFIVALENVGQHPAAVPIGVVALIGAAILVWWAMRRSRALVLTVDGDALELRAGRDTWRGSRTELRGSAGHTMLGGRYRSVNFAAIGFAVGERRVVVQSAVPLEGAARGALLIGQRFTLPPEAFKRLQDLLRLRA
jgi:hypothetical protein